MDILKISFSYVVNNSFKEKYFKLYRKIESEEKIILKGILNEIFLISIKSCEKIIKNKN